MSMSHPRPHPPQPRPRPRPRLCLTRVTPRTALTSPPTPQPRRGLTSTSPTTAMSPDLTVTMTVSPASRYRVGLLLRLPRRLRPPRLRQLRQRPQLPEYLTTRVTPRTALTSPPTPQPRRGLTSTSPTTAMSPDLTVTMTVSPASHYPVPHDGIYASADPEEESLLTQWPNLSSGTRRFAHRGGLMGPPKSDCETP